MALGTANFICRSSILIEPHSAGENERPKRGTGCSRIEGQGSAILQSAITVIVFHPYRKPVFLRKVEGGKVEYRDRGYLRHASFIHRLRCRGNDNVCRLAGSSSEPSRFRVGRLYSLPGSRLRSRRHSLLNDLIVKARASIIAPSSRMIGVDDIRVDAVHASSFPLIA